VAVSQAVRYAYEILRDAKILALEDRLILHALGVRWVDNRGTGA
jgi:hypothetical protein